MDCRMYMTLPYHIMRGSQYCLRVPAIDVHISPLPSLQTNPAATVSLASVPCCASLRHNNCTSRTLRHINAEHGRLAYDLPASHNVSIRRDDRTVGFGQTQTLDQRRESPRLEACARGCDTEHVLWQNVCGRSTPWVSQRCEALNTR